MSFGKDSSGSSGGTLPSSYRIQAPGLRLVSSNEGGTYQTKLIRTGSPEQTAYDERFPRLLTDIDKLRGTIKPGYSGLRDARLGEVENARSRAIGDLRDSLARRRVLGSSFGDAQQAQVEREFGQAREQAQAQSFLEELDANMKLIDLESNQIFSGLQRDMAELGIAANFGTQMSDLVARNAQFQQQLAAQEAAAASEGIGSLLGLGLGTALTIGSSDSDSLFGQLFSSGASSAGSSALFNSAGSGADTFTLAGA